jgi:hypothetical protein
MNFDDLVFKRYQTNMDLADIQHEIEALTVDQQAALLDWLAARDRVQWDREIEADFSSGGLGMELLERVKAQVQSGESAPIAEVRRHR